MINSFTSPVPVTCKATGTGEQTLMDHNDPYDMDEAQDRYDERMEREDYYEPETDY